MALIDRLRPTKDGSKLDLNKTNFFFLAALNTSKYHKDFIPKIKVILQFSLRLYLTLGSVSFAENDFGWKVKVNQLTFCFLFE